MGARAVSQSVTLSGWKEKREREKCTKRQTKTKTAAAAKESRPFLQNECDYCGGRAAFKANTKRSSEVECSDVILDPYDKDRFKCLDSGRLC